MKSMKTVITLPFTCRHLTAQKGMIGKDALSLMKEGVIVLNFARDVLVDSEAMVDALVAGKSKTLCYRLSRHLRLQV